MTEHQDVCGSISFAQGDYKGNLGTVRSPKKSLFWFKVLGHSGIFENANVHTF